MHIISWSCANVRDIIIGYHITCSYHWESYTFLIRQLRWHSTWCVTLCASFLHNFLTNLRLALCRKTLLLLYVCLALCRKLLLSNCLALCRKTLLYVCLALCRVIKLCCFIFWCLLVFHLCWWQLWDKHTYLIKSLWRTKVVRMILFTNVNRCVCWFVSVINYIKFIIIIISIVES